jgi:hypothetical protein
MEKKSTKQEFAVEVAKFVRHTGSTDMEIIKLSHKPPGIPSDCLTGNQNKHIEANCEHSSERDITSNAERMCFCMLTETGEEIICRLIKEASDITGKELSNRGI